MHSLSRAAGSLVLALSLASCVFGQSEAEEVANLRLAPSTVDRIKLLNDTDFVFDFLHSQAGVTTGAGGHTVAADVDTFPALVGNGMAMTVGFLGPCGFNTPHVHPRATEFNFAVNGTLTTGFLVENGARFVFNELAPGSAAVFPRGAIHFEMNNGCEPAMFVAAFNNEDPGVDQIAQRFFGLPPSFVSAALGDIGVEQVAGLEAKIPDNVALGTDECLQRCGISRTTQPTDQRQPRVSANALPSGFSGPPAPASTGTSSAASHPAVSAMVAALSSVSSSSLSMPTTTPNSAFKEQLSDDAASGAVATDSSVGSESKLSTLNIILIIVIAVLGSGYVVMGGLYFYRRKQERMGRTKGVTYFQPGSDFAPQIAIFEAEKSQPFESYQAEKFVPPATPYDTYELPPSRPLTPHDRPTSRPASPYDPPSGRL
ncbi:hypothetical protein NM688_g7417 [Phlebia brevispora]|uniref:Uncharacterized protein n=1 Tax=Phlebia brevispora TaxID=194682 RepID=A0ACC1S5N6_9APHY|nr:hypothetical protein NM688_g7417 [Phlebia brevispora]